MGVVRGGRRARFPHSEGIARGGRGGSESLGEHFSKFFAGKGGRNVGFWEASELRSLEEGDEEFSDL